jgi:hypothetical protein
MLKVYAHKTSTTQNKTNGVTSILKLLEMSLYHIGSHLTAMLAVPNPGQTWHSRWMHAPITSTKCNNARTASIWCGSAYNANAWTFFPEHMWQAANNLWYLCWWNQHSFWQLKCLMSFRKIWKLGTGLSVSPLILCQQGTDLWLTQTDPPKSPTMSLSCPSWSRRIPSNHVQKKRYA